MEQEIKTEENDGIDDMAGFGDPDMGDGITIRGNSLLTGSFFGVIFGLLLLPVYRSWAGVFQWVVFSAFVIAVILGVLMMIKWERLDVGWTLFLAGCIGAVALATVVVPFFSGTL